MATISLLLYIAGRVADLLRQGANGAGVGEGHLSPPPFRWCLGSKGYANFSCNLCYLFTRLLVVTPNHGVIFVRSVPVSDHDDETVRRDRQVFIHSLSLSLHKMPFLIPSNYLKHLSFISNYILPYCLYNTTVSFTKTFLFLTIRIHLQYVLALLILVSLNHSLIKHV